MQGHLTTEGRNGNLAIIAIPTPLAEAKRWREQEISENTEDLNDIIDKSELIEIRSFKPNRENKIFY